MTADEFERHVAGTRLQERARRMARAILVEGVSSGIAAEREGLTPQAARTAAQTVRRAAVQAGGFPSHWRVVTVIVPPDVAEDIHDMASAARKRIGLG